MARSTARKLADSTVAAAKRVTRTAAAGRASAATKTPAKTATKTAVTKAAAKKAASTKKAAPAKKAPVKKAPVKKAAATKKSAPAKKAPATTKAAPAKRTTATRKTSAAPAKNSAVKKTADRPKTPAKKVPVSTPTKKAATTKAPAATATTKKTPTKRATAPGQLAVKADESPWTKAELAEVRGDLNADRERLRSELNLAEHELHDLMRDAGDGAGNDQADVGSTTFERDHEMTLANNAREMLAQTERALARIEDGTYGVCESCGEPIGKMRLMAFPRATLCLSCKQREERR